jgi:hypothetical protein
MIAENRKRLYAKYTYTSEDENLITFCRVLALLEKTNPELFKKLYKIVGDMVRNSLKIDNLIGLAMNSKGEIVVIVYDLKATNNNFYSQHFDKEKGKFYIEIK